MANYVTNIFYGYTDAERFSEGMGLTVNSVNPDGIFASDNLVTWGRNMGFLEDEKFMSAVFTNFPDDVEKSLIWRLHVLCWAARCCSRLGGDFVEAGVYKGFTAKVLCDYLDFESLGCNYYLYDVFYHADNMEHQALPAHGDNLYAAVCKRFLPYPSVKVIQGLVPESFVKGTPEKVAFMHIDMNNAQAEVAVLDCLYERLMPGGMIVFDDYGWLAYGAQKQAEDKWLERSYLERVLELPTGQGLLIKY